MSKIEWLDRTAAPALPNMCLCLSQEAFDEVQDHLGMPRMPYINENANATVWHSIRGDDSGKSQMAVVCLNPTGHTSIAVAGILVHEATHIMQEYRDAFGFECRESEAYAVQFASQTLMEEFVRQVYG